MAVPNNPVRIFHSGNLGAQRIEGGRYDLISVLRQVLAGAFSDISVSSTLLSGTKVVLTCIDPHKLYPYQVIKLSGTGTALDGSEFFVLNDENFTNTTFALELGTQAVALPNSVTITLPTLGWSIVEDSSTWFSFRPSYDARIPVCRISKTVPNPVAGARRIYSTYLAKDTNLDGLTMKNYTPLAYIGDDGLSDTTVANMGLGTGWMVIADKQFLYFTTNRLAKGFNGQYDNYSLWAADPELRLCNAAVCYTYGVPTVLMEDFPVEWSTMYNPSSLSFRDDPNGGQTLGPRGMLHFDSYDPQPAADQGSHFTARNPQDYQGLTGKIVSPTSYKSGNNGLPYPPFGAYNTIMVQIPVEIKDKGIFGVMRGCRAYLANILRPLAYERKPTPRHEHHIKPDAFHMGLLEMGAHKGDYPMVNIIGSRDAYTGWFDKNAAVFGIRVGCSWDIADKEEK